MEISKGETFSAFSNSRSGREPVGRERETPAAVNGLRRTRTKRKSLVVSEVSRSGSVVRRTGSERGPAAGKRVRICTRHRASRSVSYAQPRYVHSVRSFRTGLPGPAPVRVALSVRPRTAALATPSVCETAFSRTAVGTRKRNFQYRVRVRETATAVHESVTPTPNDRAQVRRPVAPGSAIRTAYANRARSADAIDC